MSEVHSLSTDVLAQIANTLETRLPQNGGDPHASYAAKLYAKGPDAFLKKIAEESGEVLLAAKDGDPAHLIAETADLWFHSLVMLTWYGLRPEQVLAELARRQGLSGLAEKASRAVSAGAAGTAAPTTATTAAPTTAPTTASSVATAGADHSIVTNTSSISGSNV